ncbi:DUF1622 domain-containing protein [Methanosarcina sp.]|uniref:DUF1622 domain-containing protein n=1 Tax=Methanosarcina sp. TaxID=2213 RepID=UPI002ABBFC68|nr:DUF1622 domain-containing protein [Methanosarcina sp.]MDY9925434.1 DUF1622 domain-containing protein [Methanosarcina sp.]
MLLGLFTGYHNLSIGDDRRTLGDLENLFLDTFSSLFNVVGSVLIVYGGLRATAEIILLETFKKHYKYEHIRRELTNKLVFGLEFFIAADVLRTLRDPTQEELIVLGTVVLIRTILGYFLSKEATVYHLD